MVNVLIHHKVKDFGSWKAAFDSAFMFRKDGGEVSFRIYHGVSDPNDITLWFEWESAAAAEKFVQSEELVRQMKLAGVEGKPDVSIVQEIMSMRRTAAD
jgi:quinol monooxygenase YgiN